MLREQQVVVDTLKYFSQLHYPKKKFHIVVVTTSKEQHDKNDAFLRIRGLSQMISQGKSFDLVKEKYLGVFPFGELKQLYNKYKLHSFKVVYKNTNILLEKYPSTFYLASKTAKSINKKLGTSLISVINYPHVEGAMAHQINFAVQKLSLKRASLDSIFAVYNADSRPHLSTLKFVSYAFSNYLKQYGVVANIVQQSSLFSQNYSQCSYSFSGFFIRAVCLFQTKWTLVRELSRFRSQSNLVVADSHSWIQRLFSTRISHCVGHGLFVRLGLLAQELLPTETINEDLPFGFYQCCKREPIIPLPILENSQSPETISSVISQKKVWFTPYLQYWDCRRKVLSNKRFKSRVEVEFLFIQAIFTGFIWLFQSLIIFLPLFSSLVLHSNIIFLYWLIGITLYWFLPILVIYLNLGRLEYIASQEQSPRSLFDFLFSSLSGLLVLATHSLGPLLCVFEYSSGKFHHRNFIKLKTER